MAKDVRRRPTSMKRTYILTMFLALIACGRSSDENAPSQTATIPSTSAPPEPPSPPSTSVLSIWAHYGTHTPSMCLVLRPDGTAAFMGGFLFLNPLQWTFDAEGQILRLTVPQLRPERAAAFQSDVESKYLIAFDSTTNTLSYRFSSATTRLLFDGYWFDRPESLDDLLYSGSREGCPELLPPRDSEPGRAPNSSKK